MGQPVGNWRAAFAAANEVPIAVWLFYCLTISGAFQDYRCDPGHVQWILKKPAGGGNFPQDVPAGFLMKDFFARHSDAGPDSALLRAKNSALLWVKQRPALG
jgi:hypothetical protein